MKPERAMWQGKRLDNGEMVTGYYVYTSGDDKHWILKLNEFKREVDPATVEPVAVKVEVERQRIRWGGDVFNKCDRESYGCPNCNNTISRQVFHKDKAVEMIACKPRYCGRCGQRLDWSDK